MIDENIQHSFHAQKRQAIIWVMIIRFVSFIIDHIYCENCGFEINADLNASINIKNRIYSNVLRKSCHQEIEPNKFIPIGIKHEEFKQIYTQMLNDIY